MINRIIVPFGFLNVIRQILEILTEFSLRQDNLIIGVYSQMKGDICNLSVGRNINGTEQQM